METWQTTVLGILIGSVVPTLISMVLPRNGTIKFGMLIYKFLGLTLGQKRATADIPGGAEDSRQQKIKEYFEMHLKVQNGPK